MCQSTTIPNFYVQNLRYAFVVAMGMTCHATLTALAAANALQLTKIKPEFYRLIADNEETVQEKGLPKLKDLPPSNQLHIADNALL